METQLFLELLLLVVLLILTRILYLIHKITTGHSRKSEAKRTAPCNTLICIGSGGHTTEMLQLIHNLDFDRYTPRNYVMAKSDKTSYNKIMKFEQMKKGKDKEFVLTGVPRSREVHQSFITSMLTTIYATICSIPIVLRTMPDVIICNGPGSCVPICLISFLLKCLFVKDIRVIFVESYCRVQTFSLTGKILTYLADNFLVQWPELKSKLRRAEYIGQIM